MEVFEAVRTVLAVRAFQNKPVAPEVVQKIIEAGRMSASARNEQPWRFIVVEDHATLQELGGAAKTGPYIAQAPLAIVVAIDRTHFAVSDGSRAIQSMILTAWSEGVGSNWVGFVGMPEISKLLNIPDNLDVLAILPFGYPAKAVGRGKKKRKAVSEVVFRGKFGQSYK